MANPKITLIGNPNSGKTTLYNRLANQNQKTGNFSGVTVERRTTKTTFLDQEIELIDLPGTYTLFSTALDEQVVYAELLSPKTRPDLAIVVVDKTILRRSLFLLTQVMDLGIPCIVAFSMVDSAAKAGIEIDLKKFTASTGVQCVEINSRTGYGIDALKKLVLNAEKKQPKEILNDFIYESLLRKPTNKRNAYADFLNQTHCDVVSGKATFCLDLHRQEILKRYDFIDELLSYTGVERKEKRVVKTPFWADKYILHNVWGYVILLTILFVIFQAVYNFAAYPMDWIDAGVTAVNSWLSTNLPEGPLTSLLTEGIIAGIGGVVIFIPQIAFLFIVLTIMEESGYMARVIYLMDSIMTKFGMSGRSIVPLVSASACAIPAIMSTRSIDNWKERLITIMVTPFISCSARLPVYAILIALAVPDVSVLGIFNLKGIVFLGMYLLGVIAAFLSALIMKWIFKPQDSSFLMMELPQYRLPQLGKTIGNTVDKCKTFVFEAGKIILAISILLWVLASYGPGNKMEIAAEQATIEAKTKQLSEEDSRRLIQSHALEASYAGHFGKAIEPAIKPLGYDWKIGIALITSFAAREVFVGTLATIYSVGDEEESSLVEKMRAQKWAGSGLPVYTTATAVSLLVFYAFAMQCMSTLAIVKKETNSWKWPAIQFVYMTIVAYASSYVAYQLFS